MPFARLFQCDEPLIHILHSEVLKFCRALLNRFVKHDVLDEATLRRKLKKIDLTKPESLLSWLVYQLDTAIIDGFNAPLWRFSQTSP